MPSVTTAQPLASAARPTAPLPPHAEPRSDSLEVLDHRSRSRALPRALAPAGHYLEFQDADGDAFVIGLDRSVLHIGRAIAADLRLEDAHVSRRHAIVVRHGASARVLDDRSSTGTFVNGTRVVSQDLQEGDVIRLGPVAIRYVVVR